MMPILHLGELNKLHLSTIETLAMAVDAKDQVTHGHIRRVQRYALGLSEFLGINDERLLKAVEAAALLHDMGKLAIPEYILNKPGKLTPAEFDKMKLHAALGADILSAIQFPYPVVPIVRHHHENWDGTGYPDKLRGTEIPLGARILSVVDCYDALTSDRPYQAEALCRRGRCDHHATSGLDVPIPLWWTLLSAGSRSSRRPRRTWDLSTPRWSKSRTEAPPVAD